jgi:chemotaxis protein methyltransferase CheR
MKIGSVPATISATTYEQLCGLIYEHSRIDLGPGREGLLTSRLGLHLHELGIESWEDYRDLLRDENNSDEHDVLIDLISTNHTRFFREPNHFQRLADGLLNQLLLDCPQARQDLRCWCAAASTGEEAYSLAITLSEYALSHGGTPSHWSIDASDISRKALLRAERAIYPLNSLHLPHPELLARYFQKGTGPYEGQGKVKTNILEKVRLSKINLFQKTYPLQQPIHIIFCRNVLIYFSIECQNQLLQRLHSILAPGGLLVIGHSDSLVHLEHDFISLGGSIYRRRP